MCQQNCSWVHPRRRKALTFLLIFDFILVTHPVNKINIITQITFSIILTVIKVSAKFNYPHRHLNVTKSEATRSLRQPLPASGPELLLLGRKFRRDRSIMVTHNRFGDIFGDSCDVLANVMIVFSIYNANTFPTATMSPILQPLSPNPSIRSPGRHPKARETVLVTYW